MTKLIAWSFTGNDAKNEPTAENENDGVKLTCPNGYWKRGQDDYDGSLSLPYKDEKSGKYDCHKSPKNEDGEGDLQGTIYVKLRSGYFDLININC